MKDIAIAAARFGFTMSQADRAKHEAEERARHDPPKPDDVDTLINSSERARIAFGLTPEEAAEAVAK